MRKIFRVTLLALLAAMLSSFYISKVHAADVVPNEIKLPGTQPKEVSNFESPDKCDNCHAGYNGTETIGHPQDEPATGWRGSAMGNAGRDPVFWATMAIAEQDFDGAGDLCIRCHSTGGWYGGRSTPTDASGLAASDSDGVDCDTCHAMTNPDNSEHIGVMNAPFTANCSDDDIASNSCDSVTEGYYGSGMLSLWPGSDKLGPYSDADARHQFMQSKFHRHVDFCGSCHDVSNSAVGDLAPNHGTQAGAPPVIANGVLGGPVEEKAAFNNPPYAYGIVERTFSEYKASALPATLVSDFTNLPADLQVAGGSLETTYQAALKAGTGGNYQDGDPRYFSCQSCHMRPVESAGANKRGVQIRKDLPQHDHTGGNYWFTNMTQYQDSKNTLLIGGGLNENQINAMNLGQQRAVNHLTQAASLDVINDTVKVVNLTGHKLITGYPEGRRMWLRIEWRDANDTVIRVDGEYGGIGVMVNDENGNPVEVESILDLDGVNTEIYEAHYAVTKDWAATIKALHGPDFVLSFDRLTGSVMCTVNDFITDAKPECTGDYHNTFHFALNNYISSDNRIPPYGMSYTQAKKRNALPVPDTRYNRTGDIYDYADVVNLNPPAGADHAHIQLLYQGTSWEYIQFLQLANKGTDPDQGGNAFLGMEGENMMDAWINADVPVAMQINGDQKMVPPVVMATATWGNTGGVNNHPVATDDAYNVQQDSVLNIAAAGVLDNDSDPDGDSITAVQDTSAANGLAALAADGSFSYVPNAGFTGSDSFSYHALDSKGAASNTATVTIDITAAAQCGYTDETSCTADSACEWGGKGKNKSCSVLPPPSSCDGLDQLSCTDAAACRWSNKDAICLTR